MGQVVAHRVWALVMLLFHLVQHSAGGAPELLNSYETSDGPEVLKFYKTDMYGLQQLYSSWKGRTPDLGKNLAGWRGIPNLQETSKFPCPCFRESWRGVLCQRQRLSLDPGFVVPQYTVWIVGLTLTDASLIGSLPPAIGNLSNLVSLTITGNKDLNGSLPQELQHLEDNLNILDLEGNGFSGSIPTTLASLRQLQQLDLSGNKLEGNLGVDFSSLIWLRTLNLSRNVLTGNIQQEHLQDLKQLISLDLSSNHFTGPLPNLTASHSLNTLDLSYNAFSGEVHPLSVLNSTNIQVVDLSNNRLGGLFPDFSAWTSLLLLDLSYNQFQGVPFPMWIKSLHQNLYTLRLKGNNLSGHFPTQYLKDFKNLRTLALDNNSMNGTFDVGDVIALPMLQSLSIANNSFTNVIYNGSSIKAIQKFGINMRGNPYCVQISPQDYLKQCVCEQQCNDPDPEQNGSKKAVIATSVAASVFAVITLIISLIFWKTRREKQKLELQAHNLQLQVQQYFAEMDVNPSIFTFNQLRNATQDFSQETKLGEGSFGAVYKGYLGAKPNYAEGMERSEGLHAVAVKQLFIRDKESRDQSIAEFLNEVVVVTAIKHRNLVNLKGFCIREDQRLLVYEYVDNRDLEHHLFHKSDACSPRAKEQDDKHLSWPSRFNICLGVARGLHYLHAYAQPKIIHRDIKASNILLDMELQPKIADFGLALIFPDEISHRISAHVAGTRGYWAPEYVTNGQLSEKVDVYSFGVLLLELVSGRKNLDSNMPDHQVYLCHWAKDLYNESKVMELVDPKVSLKGAAEIESVQRVISIAMLCIQMEPERRPTMAAVVATLEGNLNLEAVDGNLNGLFQEEPLLICEALEEQPLRGVDSSILFTTETPSSSVSVISLASMGNYRAKSMSTTTRQIEHL